MRNLVIYHANCTDGFTAAWVFHRLQQLFPEAGHFEFFAAAYGTAPPAAALSPGAFDRIYLVDFSYPRDVVKKILTSGGVKDLFLIDHHATAIADLDGLDKEFPNFFAFTDVGRSGARLAWDFMMPAAEPPRMLDYVQDRDLWQFKLPMSKQTNAYIGSVERTFENWDELMLGGDDVVKHARWAATGEALTRSTLKNCKELARGADYIDVLEWEGIPVCNCPGHLASDVGHLLSENAPFAMTYHLAHGKLLFSLRTRRNDVHVGLIAAKLAGGGGHRGAAGFSVSWLDLHCGGVPAVEALWNQITCKE